mmetsp:Transcript_21424/g.49869  ORF Transcript_21424/g.49869 Transcript_21424/m.49869 type:complete len:213 (-) Transcript_21424:131-769(-)
MLFLDNHVKRSLDAAALTQLASAAAPQGAISCACLVAARHRRHFCCRCRIRATALHVACQLPAQGLGHTQDDVSASLRRTLPEESLHLLKDASELLRMPLGHAVLTFGHPACTSSRHPRSFGALGSSRSCLLGFAAVARACGGADCSLLPPDHGAGGLTGNRKVGIGNGWSTLRRQHSRGRSERQAPIILLCLVLWLLLLQCPWLAGSTWRW